jgi:hypothetical protein
MQKGSYTNLVLAERTTFAEIIERYIIEVLPTMPVPSAIQRVLFLILNLPGQPLQSVI